MNRQEMLEQLSKLPHPITEGLTVSDEGCEFSILTKQQGFFCFVGGRFPLNGPLKLSRAQHADLLRVKSLRADESLEEAIDEHIRSEKRKEYLLDLLFKSGEDAVEEVLTINWPPEKYFYVFQDMGRGEAAVFPSLESAYAHFLRYFTEEIADCYPGQQGISWDSMDDVELTKWYEMLRSWRSKGSKRLPPRSWLGAYYSPMG